MYDIREHSFMQNIHLYAVKEVKQTRLQNDVSRNACVKRK